MVADRFEHPPHLAVSSLMDGQLDATRPEPAHAGRRGGPVVEPEAVGQPQGDQTLPEHVLHRLPEAQIDPERERRDDLRQPGPSLELDHHAANDTSFSEERTLAACA